MARCPAQVVRVTAQWNAVSGCAWNAKECMDTRVQSAMAPWLMRLDTLTDGLDSSDQCYFDRVCHSASCVLSVLTAWCSVIICDHRDVFFFGKRTWGRYVQ